jgi:predicted deacylase
MERLRRVQQQLAPRAVATAAAAAVGVGGNAEPWWDTAPGTKRAYSHQLGPGVEAWAPGRALPVLVVKGSRPGPTLLVSAGIHGNEYDGMVAIRRVWEELDAVELSGTLVGIMCCNVDAHLVPDRNSASDGQNLARVFPGRAEGTLTERVAYCIQHDFIEKATLMCDLHTAGLDMRMIPIVGYTLDPPPGNPDALEQARAAAKAFGLKTIWSNAVDDGAPELTFQPGDEAASPFSKGTSGVGAWLAGVPFLYTEATGSGGVWSRDVDLYAQGVRNLLRHLRISPGQPTRPPADQVVVEDFTRGSGNLQHQHVTPVGGLFHAEVGLYARVEQGQRLGTVRDLFGETIHEVRASRTGVLITVRHVARVRPGDALANIAPNAGPPEDEAVALY